MKVWLSLVLGLRMIGIKRISGILEDKGIDDAANKVVAAVLNAENILDCILCNERECRREYSYGWIWSINDGICIEIANLM